MAQEGKQPGSDTFVWKEQAGSDGNAVIYSEDKLQFGYVTSNEQIYDKDVNNYNFAKIEEFLSPLFIQKGNGDNTDTTATEIKEQLLNLIYPVGSIYMNINNVSPSVFLGGTWERVAQGACLFGAENNAAGGKTGGANQHTITAATLPTHTHSLPNLNHKHTFTGSSHSHKAADSTELQFLKSRGANWHPSNPIHVQKTSSGTARKYMITAETDNTKDNIYEASYTANATAGGTVNNSTDLNNKSTNQNTGVNKLILDNRPQYLTVCMWERTA